MGAGTSLVVKCLRLQASIPGVVGSIPGRVTKIPHAAWHSQNIKKKEKKGNERIEINSKKGKKQNFVAKPTLSWIFRGIVIKVVNRMSHHYFSTVYEIYKNMQWDKGIKCVRMREAYCYYWQTVSFPT